MKNLHQLPGEKREIIPVFATSALQNTVSGNHSFAVPKGLLAELINRLIALVPVERIYLSEYAYHANAFEELTILMPHSSKMHIAEARPLVNMLMATYPSYRYRLFYAPEVKAALDKGIALVVTEFGTTEASGNGPVDKAETQLWWDFMDQYGISWCNWSIAEKNETSAALKPRTTKKANWKESGLTTSGKFIRNELKRRNP